MDQIHRLRAGGFDTFKLNGGEAMRMLDSVCAIDRAISVPAQVRDAFGTEVDFGLDFHGRVALPMAKPLLRALEPLRPLFVEEPVLAEQAEYYPVLAAATSIPLAAGERMYTRQEFKQVAFASLAIIFGVSYSFAAFFASFAAEFQARRADIALVFGLCGLVYFIGGIGGGMLADRSGDRLIGGLCASCPKSVVVS